MMITTISSYVRRAYEQRSLRPLTDRQVDDVITAIDFDDLIRQALQCRVCGKRPEAQVTGTTADGKERVEYLCFEDLGVFIGTFAVGVHEFSVVRL